MPNLPTILVAGIIAIIFVAIVANEIRKKKRGQGSCSCGCSGCGMSDVCHGNQKETEKNKNFEKTLDNK